MANYALILAGGVGSRTGQSIPKQFISVNDKPIIIYTLEHFQNCKDIDGIVVCCLEGWEPFLNANAQQYGISKLKFIINQGVSRLDTIEKGVHKICEFAKDEDVIVVHDGIRPCVENDIILDSINTAKEKKIAVCYLHMADTVYVSRDFKSSNESYDRSLLARGQTPVSVQCKYATDVLNKVKEENLSAGGCIATAVLAVGDTVYGSMGSEKNIKITTKEDIDMFKALLMYNINKR